MPPDDLRHLCAIALLFAGFAFGGWLMSRLMKSEPMSKRREW